jgi:hypothetical protein
MYGWEHSDSSLGILLTGKKGLGKSFTANLFCTKLDMPVIKITREIGKGEGLVDFLNGIKQDHILYIDEFEKIYRGEGAQSNLLSLLDGTSLSKHLFFFTVNEKSINQFMLNRPGRIYYVFNYDCIEDDVAKAYVDKNLKHKQFKDDVLEICDCFTRLNFDILQTIVEETNNYKESPRNFMDFLNASPANEGSSFYRMKIYYNGKFDSENHSGCLPYENNDVDIFSNGLKNKINSNYINISHKNLVKKVGKTYIYEISYGKGKKVRIEMTKTRSDNAKKAPIFATSELIIPKNPNDEEEGF